MSASWQLGALINKNLILMKRSPVATLCEIFFPIILMILLVTLRKTIKITEYDDPILDRDYLKTNSTLLISLNELTVKDPLSIYEISPKWDGMTLRNPL